MEKSAPTICNRHFDQAKPCTAWCHGEAHGEIPSLIFTNEAEGEIPHY
jgi:hypothetical protein